MPGFGLPLSRSLGRILGLCALDLILVATAGAGPLEEVRALSNLPALELAKLKSGEIVTQRGDDSAFARGITMESCYFIAVPMAAVVENLLHWNPSPHPELATPLYREYALNFGAAFPALGLSSQIANDRWLLDHTYAIAEGGAPNDLHLTAAEVQLIRKGVPKKETASAQEREARAKDVWGQILRQRSESLARGGLAAVAPFGDDPALSPDSEFRGLLTLNPKVAKHFEPILGARPFASKGSAPDEAVGYWDTMVVRGHSTLQLGVFAGRKGADSWQLADCVYYPSDTYFMALDVFQLWPVEGGTLVYQVGFVAAPFRAYLGGIDRYVASKQMTRETVDTIKAFRADVTKRP